MQGGRVRVETTDGQPLANQKRGVADLSCLSAEIHQGDCNKEGMTVGSEITHLGFRSLNCWKWRVAREPRHRRIDGQTTPMAVAVGTRGEGMGWVWEWSCRVQDKNWCDQGNVS
jgi:hypothetical protein